MFAGHIDSVDQRVFHTLTGGSASVSGTISWGLVLDAVPLFRPFEAVPRVGGAVLGAPPVPSEVGVSVILGDLDLSLPEVRDGVPRVIS